MMPKVDGFEVLAIMNKNKWLEQIPVIIISSETAPAYIDNAYDLGGSGIYQPAFLNPVRCSTVFPM